MTPESRRSFGRREVRAFRDGRVTTSAPNITVGELETHYRRLQRVNKGSFWKRLFGGVGTILVGGVVGALLTESGWTDEVKIAAALAAACLVAWYAVRDTEIETIGAICEDYKCDIVDSIEFEEDGSAVQPAEALVRKGERSL